MQVPAGSNVEGVCTWFEALDLTPPLGLSLSLHAQLPTAAKYRGNLELADTNGMSMDNLQRLHIMVVELAGQGLAEGVNDSIKFLVTHFKDSGALWNKVFQGGRLARAYPPDID